MRHFCLSTLVIVSLLSVVACQKESSFETTDNAVTDSFSFTSVKPALDSETRTEWTGSGINWSAGDAIKMAYTVNDNWQNANGDATITDGKSDAKIYQSSALTEGGQKAEFKVSGSFKGSTTGTHVFYSVYPGSAVSSTNFEYAPSMTVVIPKDQKPEADSFDSSADLMIGVSTEKYTSRPTTAIPLMWTRLVAHGYFSLKDFQDLEEGETVKTVTLTAQDGANLVGTEYVSIVDGSYRAAGGSTNITNILYIDGSKLSFVTEEGKKNLNVWLSVMPETLTSLKVEVETNKATYTRQFTGISLTLKANSRNLLSINMNGATKVSTTIPERLFPDGEYLFTITHNDGGNKMMSASISSPQQAVATSTEVNEGVYEADKAAVWTVTYNETDGTYSILSVDKEKYLYGGAGATDLKADSNDPVYFSVEEVEDGVYTFSVKEGSNIRYLSYNYNDGSDRFAMYYSSEDYVKSITLLPAVAKEEQQIIEIPKAGTDVINYSFSGISGTSYADWGHKQGSATNAYYKGNSGGQNNSVQLRTNNNNSGIITWKSSGYVKSITVTWNSNTADGRTLDIYGKNTAYEETTDLYNADKQGTKVGSIVKGSSTTYTFDKNYKYVGIRSSNGAMYLDNISIEWGTEAIQETVATPSISCNNNVVSISCDTEGASIYYTLDGPDPTTTSTQYTLPLTLVSGDDYIVKAIAVKSNFNNSQIVTKHVSYVDPSAQPITVTFDSFVFNSNDKTVSGGNSIISILQEKGSSTNDVANYTAPIRFYKGHTLTISCTQGYTITNISFGMNGTYTMNDVKVGDVTLTDNSWSGSGSEVVFQNTGNQTRFNSITVTYQ